MEDSAVAHRAGCRTGRFGARRAGAVGLVSVIAMAAGAKAQCPIEKLTSPTQSGGDLFGRSLAGDDDELVVGARYSVTVYSLDDKGTSLDVMDDEWVLQAHLLSQDPALGDGFGAAVWLDGDHLIVGAPEAGGPFGGPGAAHVFGRSGPASQRGPAADGWFEQSELAGLSGFGFGAAFGAAVGVSGIRAAVGAPGEQLPAQFTASGVVHVFRLDDNGTPLVPEDDTWPAEAVFASGDPSYSAFGSAVQLTGDRLLVGAPGLAWQPAVGVVFDFRLDDGGTPTDPADDSWIEHAKISAPTPAPPKLFGRSLQLDGNRLLVGAGGASYLFRLDDGGTPTDPADDFWVDDGTLVGDDSAPIDNFGHAVALEGVRALVGAPAKSEGDSSGAVYLFIEAPPAAGGAPATWTQALKLTAQESGATNFGAEVRVHGPRAFVGETGSFPFASADSANSDTGAVRSYGLAEGPWSFVSAALAGTGAPPCLMAAGSLQADSATSLKLEQAVANAASALVIGSSGLFAPFKGGVLVPLPESVVWLTTDSDGDLALSARWPIGVGSGTEVIIQAWTIDGQAPKGLSASNAIWGVVP